MGAVSLRAMVADELGYDADDGVPQATEVVARGVPTGAMIRARRGTEDVAVARLASGKLVIVQDACPHDGSRISDGYVDGERLVCARHGWELVVTAGRCERAATRCRKLRE